jgi:adenylate kinase
MSLWHVILMGPQGSGKGTQSERIRRRLDLASVATGELFRQAIKEQSALGKRIQAIYDRGELVPDDLTVALVEERLGQLAKRKAAGEAINGVLYDGFPRTEGQAEALERALASRGEGIDAVIAIDVPRARLIERLAGRRVCASCGRVYNVVSDPPLSPGVCDACGGELVQRADDSPSAVGKRLDLYELETAPLVEKFGRAGYLKRVDGDRDIDEVTDAILAAIDEAPSVESRGTSERT